MTEHNLPWVYRPRHYDDWGWIRDATGAIAACARGDKRDKTYDEHRADNTDPYGEYAAFIVKAVNSHELLVKALEKIRDDMLCDPKQVAEDALSRLVEAGRNG